MNPEEILGGMFEPQVDPTDIKPEDIIDVDDIQDEARSIATKLVNKVKKIYFTKEELKKDGYALSVCERAIDSIAILEKMLISNNQLQDKLILNICLNSSNSNLYMSLTRIQAAIIDIQSQVTKEIDNLHSDLRSIVADDIEEDEDDEVEEIESKTAFRGGKDFLKSLKNEE